MATIAKSFSDRVNSKQGDASIEDIILQDYITEIKVRNQPKNNREVIEFRDGSKILIDSTTSELIVKEILAYKAWPFVQIGIGNALVSTDHNGDIFIQFPNGGKSIKVSSKSNKQVSVSGIGLVQKFNGNEYTFE